MADDNRIFELVEEALCSGQTPEEVCADDPKLLPEVRARLDECRRVDLMVENMFPAHPQQRILNSQSQPGAPLPEIPGYEVLGVLGRGGHGIVYRVRHLKLKRLAALKMLLTGEYASSAELARFMREAEAIAALQHPNIVQIYEIGEVDGRPYFTMEFVGGGSLAQKLGGVPQPARDAASVIEALANAIDTAHRAGIIHRDVKPANVLLTDDGTAKITDFGLARFFEGKPDVTLGAAKAGTPSYMAPEQIVGEPGTVGPAADIYALGATLYELLTGRPPFRAETATETERQVLSQEPASPTRLNARVPRDLETICLKCLQKEPARRYESAASLADDLERFWEDRPIRARPVGWAARSWRWCRRNPATAALAAIAVVLFASATGAGFWLEKQRTEHRAEARRRDTELRREVGTEIAQAASLREGFHFREARKLLEQARQRLGLTGPGDLRRQTDQAWADVDIAQRLDNARAQAATLVGGRFDPSGAEPLYASAFAELGLGHEGDDSKAVASRIQESALRAQIVAALDDWASITPYAAHRVWLLGVAREADSDPARNRLRQPELWQNPDQLIRVAQELKVAELSPQLATALGRVARAAGKDAITLLTAAQSRFPQDFWVNFELGFALANMKRWDEALGYFRAALALRPDASVTHNNVGAVLQKMERADEALPYFREALRLDPKNVWTLCNLGDFEQQRGNLDDAIDHLQQAIRINPASGLAYEYLGLALYKKGRPDEAIDAHRRAIRLEPLWPLPLFNLGVVLRDSGRTEEAISCFRQAVRIGPKDVVPLYYLGFILRDTGRPDQAIEYFRQALRLDRKLGVAQFGLATSLYAAGRDAALSAIADQGHLDELERANKRRQALAWLREDLEFRTQVMNDGPFLGWSLAPWQTDSGLSSVRDPADVAKLPVEEREQWQHFWSDVAALRAADLLERGRTLAARRQWAQAIDLYVLSMKGRPSDNGHFLFELAALSLLKGDRVTYTNTCNRMVEVYDKSSALRAYHVARACTLAPDSVADPSLVDRIAEKEIAASNQQFWSLTEQGALAYRAGRFQDSPALFERSLQADHRPGPAVVNWLWLALTKQRLGRTEEARRWLNQAQVWLDRYKDGLPDDAEREFGLDLHNWLEANVLRREAEAMIAPSTSPKQ